VITEQTTMTVLGYDDRKCFEVALDDGGQSWDRDGSIG